MKVLCAICLLVGAIAITQSWVRSPTTTELFNLRSRYTELGDKILSEQKKVKQEAGIGGYYEQTSHYDLPANRCYINLTIVEGGIRQVLLYDGQTKHLLAYANYYRDGTQAANVFDKSSSFSNSYDWKGTIKYMDQMMAETK